MPVVVEQIADVCKLGEGPHWDESTQSLYYVDIFGHAIHRYTPSTKNHSKAIVGNNTVSFCIPIEGKEKFLIGYGRQVAAITWDGVSDKVTDFQKIAEVDIEDDLIENRINDAKCDQSGRLWFGTMGAEPEIAKIIPHKGSLYSLGIDDQVKHHLSEVTCSNGLAWSADNTNFYYIDSGTYEIHQYDFDIASGEISNKKVVFSLKEVSIEGFADGHTIDTDGNLWVAIFNGSKVIKIDPRRKNALLQTVDIPAKQVTSVTFGGPNFDELYVTTAGVAGNDSMLPSPNGAIFRLTGLGVKGFGGVRAK